MLLPSVVQGDASAGEIEDHRPQAEFTRVNGALGRCGETSAVSRSDVNRMSARKHIRAVTRIDCEAVLMAEDDAALVDALGKGYLDVDRTLPRIEDRIREQVAMASASGRHCSEKTRAR